MTTPPTSDAVPALPVGLPPEYATATSALLERLAPASRAKAIAALAAYVAGPMHDRPTANHHGAIRRLIAEASA